MDVLQTGYQLLEIIQKLLIISPFWKHNSTKYDSGTQRLVAAPYIVAKDFEK
jgi:hypothetical protein